MIRFRCTQCQKILKAPPDRVGAKATCPDCGTHTRVPASSNAPSKHVDKENRLSEKVQESLHEVLPPMGPRVKNLFIALAGLLLLSLIALLAVGGTLSGVLFMGSLIALLTSLHGHGTSCPSCHQWWAKAETNKELFDRIIFYKDAAGKVVGSEHATDEPLTGEGTPFVRSTYKTHFQCSHCRHRWYRTFAMVYKHVEPKPGRTHAPERERIEND